MKLSDFTRPAPCVPAVSAVALATVSSASAHAGPGSLEPVLNAEAAASSPLAIHFSVPLEPATYALAVQ
jgi:hypothetical protein